MSDNYFLQKPKPSKKRGPLKNLYVSTEFHKWLKKQSAQSGQPMCDLADQLMELAVSQQREG